MRGVSEVSPGSRPTTPANAHRASRQTRILKGVAALVSAGILTSVAADYNQGGALQWVLFALVMGLLLYGLASLDNVLFRGT